MRGARERAGGFAPVRAASLDAVGRTTFTRRRALVLGAAAGLGSLLGPLRSVPAFATRTSRPRSFGLTVTPADFDGGRVSRVLRVRRFDVLGVRGSGHVDVRVRSRRGGWGGGVRPPPGGGPAPGTGDRR